jgi:hypothetical protein
MSTESKASQVRINEFLMGISAVAFVVVAITGVLLSLWYVPSSDPLRMADGRTLTVITSTRTELVGPFTDTLVASPENPCLAPARSGQAVTSAAQSSIRVAIHNAPFGQVVRRIHYWMSDVLLAALTALLVIMCLRRCYETDRSLWLRALALTAAALAGGWTGRILVDDVYAEISRRIMGHELASAPMGDIIVRLLGIEPGSLLLARTYSLHGLILGAFAMLVFATDMRQAFRGARSYPPLLAGLLAAVGVSLISIPDWGMRDAVRGLAGWERVSPWWGIVPFRAWSQWLGSELAGYVAIALTTLLVTLPFWHRRMARTSVVGFLILLGVMLVAGLLFGN